MNFRLLSLRSEPEIFDPVSFHEGVNIVMGEKWDDNAPQGRKTNGVGKSLFVEILHFALLRDASKTRLVQIPEDIFAKSAKVHLNLTIGNQEICISRSLADANEPIITVDDKQISFSDLDAAHQYLGDLLFEGSEASSRPSWRQLLSLLMRDEKSEFADVLRPHKLGNSIPPSLEPHLYLLGINPEIYLDLRKSIEELDAKKKLLKTLKEDLTQRGQTDLKEIPAELNRERKRIEEIEKALDKLQAEPVYEELEADIVALETTLRKARAERQAIAYRIKQIEQVPLAEEIDQEDIRIVFDRIKEGLGEMVNKSLEQAITFKEQIQRFQNQIRNKEKLKLKGSYEALSANIREDSEKYAQLVSKVDERGSLQELRTGLEEALSKQERFQGKEQLYKTYKHEETNASELEATKQTYLAALKRLLEGYESLSSSLNETFVEIHSAVMDSETASVMLKVVSTGGRKYPLEIEVNVKDSGSHGVDHMGVFIYDMTLLFNQMTRVNHPGFLLHDNIFETDRDSCVQALNFLAAQEESGQSFQYILTLNRDKIETDEVNSEINLNLDKAKILKLTKRKPFLREWYQQIAK